MIYLKPTRQFLGDEEGGTSIRGKNHQPQRRYKCKLCKDFKCLQKTTMRKHIMNEHFDDIVETKSRDDILMNILKERKAKNGKKVS